MATPSWIAIVDDDPSVLKALSRSLRLRSHHTKAYRSAQDFLAALPDGLPACLIADVQMPGMTGLELLQRLRHRGVRIPTIIVTAHGDPAVRERCQAAGVDAFLSKPYRNAALFAAVDAVFESGDG